MMRLVLDSEKPMVPSVSWGLEETVTSDTLASGSDDEPALRVVAVVLEAAEDVLCDVADAVGG